MDRAHTVCVMSFNGPLMQLRVDGVEYLIDLARHSRRLAQATQRQLEQVEVSAAGYGLHWPEVDEDLSVDGLLAVQNASASVERTAQS